MSNNLHGSIDLLRLQRTGIATIRGVKCLCIPIQENDIYVGMGENLKATSAYLGLSIFERKEVGKYGDTHNVKQSFSKEFRDAMGKEEIDKRPYLGNMKPLFSTNVIINAPETAPEEDDLPF